MSPELEVGLMVAGCVGLLGWGTWVTISVMHYNRKIEETSEVKKDFGAFEIKLNLSLNKSEEKQKEMEERITVSIDNFDKTLHLWKDTMINELKSILRDDRVDRRRQHPTK